MKRVYCISLFLTFYFFLPAQQQVKLDSLYNLNQPLPLYLTHLQVYQEQANEITAEQAASQEYKPFSYYFSSIPRHLPANKGWWLKLEIENSYTRDTTVVFYAGFQNYIDVYLADAGRYTLVAKCGNMIPASQLNIPNFRQAVYLPLQGGKVNIFYIRIYNRTTYHTDALRPFLMSKASLNEIQLNSLQENRIGDFIFILGIGMFLIMVIYLLIKWAYLKDVVYFYYAISLFCGAVYYISNFIETGNNMLVFKERPWLVYMFSDMFAFIGVFGYWQFVRKFLYVDREKPILGRYMKMVAYGILVYMVITHLIILVNGNIWQYIQRNTITGIVVLVLGLYVIVGIRKLNQPLRRVIYGGVLITVLFYATGSFYEMVRGTRYEFLPEQVGGAPILMLGTTIQMLFSVIGLAYRHKLESVQMAEFNMQKTEAEMKALRAQMNPHFIFNCLHTIDAYIFKEQPDKASSFLNRFSKLIRQTLENSEKNLITLSNEIQSLKIFTQLEEERYDYNFDVVFDMQPGLEECLVPPLLLQPLVENAILHGLRHLKNQRGRLVIAAASSNGELIIRIRDNGIGRNAAAEINKMKGKAHRSMALELTRQRLRFYNNAKLMEGSVKINDLNNSNESGTEVLIWLPIIKAL